MKTSLDIKYFLIHSVTDIDEVMTERFIYLFMDKHLCLSIVKDDDIRRVFNHPTTP